MSPCEDLIITPLCCIPFDNTLLIGYIDIMQTNFAAIKRLAARPVIIPILVYLLSITLYVTCLAPSSTWGDSSEFCTNVGILGCCHPTGYPIYTLLGRTVATFFPFGDIAMRTNLLSALAAAGALSLLSILTWMMTRSRMASLAAAALLAFSHTFWTHAVMAEVYTLNSFFMMLMAVILVRWYINLPYGRADESRLPQIPLALFALAVGLAFGNHMGTVLFAPSALFLLARAKPKSWKSSSLFLIAAAFFVMWGLYYKSHSDIGGFSTCMLLAALFGVAFLWNLLGARTFFIMGSMFALAYSAYLYLPIRSRVDTMMDWGNPENIGNFLWVVRAEQYQYRMFKFISEHNWSALFEALQRLNLPIQFTILCSFISIFGLFSFTEVSRRRKHPVSSNGMTFLVFTLLLFFTCIAYTVNYDIPDSPPYFIPAYTMFALWFGWGLMAIRDIASSIAKSIALHAGRNDERALLISRVSGVAAGALILASTLIPAQANTHLALRAKRVRAWATRLDRIHLKPAASLAGFMRKLSSGYDKMHREDPVDKSGVFDAYTFGRKTFDAMDEEAVMLTEYDGRSFTLWYFNHVLDKRYDVGVFYRYLFNHEWYLQNFHAAYPDVIFTNNSHDQAASLQNILARNMGRRPMYAVRQDPAFVNLYNTAPTGWLEKIPIFTVKPKPKKILSASEFTEQVIHVPISEYTNSDYAHDPFKPDPSAEDNNVKNHFPNLHAGLLTGPDGVTFKILRSYRKSRKPSVITTCLNPDFTVSIPLVSVPTDALYFAMDGGAIGGASIDVAKFSVSFNDGSPVKTNVLRSLVDVWEYWEQNFNATIPAGKILWQAPAECPVCHGKWDLNRLRGGILCPNPGCMQGNPLISEKRPWRMPNGKTVSRRVMRCPVCGKQYSQSRLNYNRTHNATRCPNPNCSNEADLVSNENLVWYRMNLGGKIPNELVISSMGQKGSENFYAGVAIFAVSQVRSASDSGGS